MILALLLAASVRIGIINSVTGAEAPIGETLSNGYKLAVEDLKKAGIEVDLVSEDDTGKPQISLSALEKLVTRDKVTGIVGPYSSSSANPTVKAAEKNKVPILIPTAAKEELTRMSYKYVFRIASPANGLASAGLDATLALGPAKKLAVVYENTDFGTSTAKTAKEYAAKHGLQLVADEAYSKGSPDYRSTLTQVKSAEPDVVFMVSYVADAILLIRQARELALSPKAFIGGGAGFSQPQFVAERDISEGILASTHWTKDSGWPGAKEFAERYQKRFNVDPPYHSACAYESLRIMAECAAKANNDREKTRACLREGKWDGIMGPVQFVDYDGFQNQNKHPVLVTQVQQGKVVTVYPKENAVAKPVYPFKWK
jgi:branched-chain amino acid transport system substrate-binding protein